MNFDDESDLTSLDGEEELKDATTRDLQGHQSDTESSLSSLEDEVLENGFLTPQEDVQRDVLLQLSPSRVGSTIARPAPAVGLKTYGGRKARSNANSEPKTPQKSTIFSRPLGDESPLTPLSSPSPKKRRVSTSAQQTSNSPTKRSRGRNGLDGGSEYGAQRASTSGHKTASNGGSASSNHFSPSLKRKSKHSSRRKAPSSTLSATIRNRGKQHRKVDKSPLETLGNFVWVRVDRDNASVYDASGETFWWPAKIKLASARQRSLKARLFSPLPGASTNSLIDIQSPSSMNVLSFKGKAFSVDSFWSLPPSSSRSQPTDLENLKSRWHAAVKAMEEEGTRADDGFPTSLTALLSQPLSDEEDDNDRASKTPEKIAASQSEEAWVPPPPDPNIAVPGEHVLSATKSKGCKGNFYPAKIVAYISPTNPATPPRYTVHFMDNFQEDVTRNMFYTYEQDEFGTCKLGVYQSVESFYDKDGDDDLDNDFLMKTTDRATIPERPLLPVPSPEKFCELTMLEQAVYIVPILRRITENNYTPAEKRITAFLNGGQKRIQMSKEAPQKGILTRSELSELACIIRRWALGLYSSSAEMRDDSGLTEIDTHKRLGQAPLSPPETDMPQESTSTPDDLIEKQIVTSELTTTDNLSQQTSKVEDTDLAPSLPPSSLPPSSLTDESPNNTPKGVEDEDLNINTRASVNGTHPSPDDLRTENGVYAAADEQTLGSAPKPARLTFKDLLDHEKLHFVTDVLLQEAVIQLLLWRVGKRRDPDPLSETEERLLHESGSNLASEFDIAHAVMDLRMKKEKSLQAHVSSKQPLTTGGTRSRPRKY